MNIKLENSSIYSTLLDTALAYFSTHYVTEEFNANKHAQNFLDINNDKDEGEIIFGFPIIRKEDIILEENKSTEKVEDIYPKLDSFIQELKQFAAIKYAKNGKGFTRMDAPPKEAFEYVGHNKLNIKTSNIASALLYED
ncbi:MAG: hypothetical protein IPN29_00820 [Saprospiraceae bacterium]|nr:hypothetical protein [Saprospiraceae bacterium]